jgi:DNA-binding response OmpR family regulator
VEESVGKKILIVDDEIDLTTLLKKGLESDGFYVGSYNDPLLALHEFRAGFYDLMLIDIRMPKMNGFEYYHKLRNKDINMRVCFMTAFPLSYEEVRKMLPVESITRQNLIQKPIGIKELIKRINEILR